MTSSIKYDVILSLPLSLSLSGEVGGEGNKNRGPGRMEETGQPYLAALFLYAHKLSHQPLENKVFVGWGLGRGERERGVNVEINM